MSSRNEKKSRLIFVTNMHPHLMGSIQRNDTDAAVVEYSVEAPAGYSMIPEGEGCGDPCDVFAVERAGLPQT